MSGRSRGARDVLDEIRRVISHLERKDSVLNQELKTWKSVSFGSDTEKIQALVEENVNLKEQVKQNSDISGEKIKEIRRLKDENAHLQGSISAKDAEIKKLVDNLSFEQMKVNLIEKNYKELTEKLKRCEADLLDTRAEMNSYSSAYDKVIEEKTALKTENVELRQNIHRLKTTAASTDQTQLQQDYDDLSKKFNNVEAESKRNKENSDHNHTVADQYRTLYEQTKKEKENIQEEIAKLRSGGVAAPVQSLVSPHQPPLIATRLDVGRPEDPTTDPIASAKANSSQNNPASQPPPQEQKSYMGAAVGAVGSTVGGVLHAFGFGGAGGGTKTVDNGNGKHDTAVASSDSGGPAVSAAPDAVSSDAVSPQYTVNAVVNNNGNEDTNAPAAAASSNNTVGGQLAAGKAQEDYSDILNIEILNDKVKIVKLFEEMGLKMPDKKNHAAIVYVQIILESEQYKQRLLKTAKYYNINTTIPDDKKIDQIWKFFSEFERLKGATKADFEAVCTFMNFSKERTNLIQNFPTMDPKQRAEFSYQLFNKLKVDKSSPSVESLYHQAGFVGKLNKPIMIDALIEDRS